LHPTHGDGSMPKKAHRRELNNTRTDKRYVRRDEKGQFKESDDVGRSLTADRRHRAKRKAPKGRVITLDATVLSARSRPRYCFS
jgi:hypothetical protein